MTADLRLALRLLARQPGYAAIVILTLGLGIGAVSAVFTLADPLIFRALPFADADRIVEVRANVPTGTLVRLHADDFVVLSEHATTLDAVATAGGLHVGTLAGSAEPVLGYGVSREFLRLTGLSPALGRVFAAGEYDRVEDTPPVVAMLTWPFWQSAFGGRRDVIGQRLELSARTPLSMTIVGVLPREFFFPEAVNEAPGFLVPDRLNPAYLGRPNVYPTIFARVRPDATFAQAEAELTGLLRTVEAANPKFEQSRRARVLPLQAQLFKGLRTPLLLLFTATACLLLLAWVNLSHLMRARVQARTREVAVRLSLGAGRWRIARQTFVEIGVLSLLGAAAGLGIGQALHTWGMSITPRFDHVYRLLPGSLDARVVLFAMGLALAGVVVTGLGPVVRATRGDLRESLSVLPERARRWRAGGEALALAGQTAFAIGLLVTCLLVVRSFVGVVTRDRGFDPASVQLASVQWPAGADTATLAGYHRGLVAELGRVRGVAAAALGNGVPALTLPEAAFDAAGTSRREVVLFQTSGGFAGALQMHLEEGRLFTDDEAFRGEPYAVVDRGAADLMWPGQPATGQIVRTGSGRTFTVVGVVARVRTRFYDDDTAASGIVLATPDLKAPAVVNRLSTVVRFDRRRPPSPEELAAAARRVHPAAAWRGAAGLSSWERLVGQPRFLASALGLLAAVTAALATLGVLGVVSHYVARRTREIGIRIAIGATPARVRRSVLRAALVPALVGIAGGLALAYWWSASVRSVLLGIGPHDPWSFAGAAFVTLVIVVAAGLRPAIAASRIDPIRTLRVE
jgi:predicted permease